jgi:hypothetical protein
VSDVVITASEPDVVSIVNELTTIDIVSPSEEQVLEITSETCSVEILSVPETIIEIISAGIPAPIVDSTPPLSSAVINRTDGEITSIVYEDGKTVTITRTDGEITSVDDGTYTKTIIREDNEIIGVQVNG